MTLDIDQAEDFFTRLASGSNPTSSASDCSDDFFRISLPVEWLRVDVVVCDVSVDGGLQIDDAGEGSAFEASLGQRGEEALNRVQP